MKTNYRLDWNSMALHIMFGSHLVMILRRISPKCYKNSIIILKYVLTLCGKSYTVTKVSDISKNECGFT